MGVPFCKPAKKPQEDKRPPPATVAPYDYYRCSDLRYLGFASVIAGKIVPPNFAHIPNMAATAYIFSDVFNKTLASVENEDDPKRTVITAVDALLWQTMASVIAPLLLYTGLKHATRLAFVKTAKPPPIHHTKAKSKIKQNLTDKCGRPIPPPPPPPTAPKTIKCPIPPEIKCPVQNQFKHSGEEKKFPTPTFLRVFPGIVSLALMPFILKPIQCAVDDLMDATYRAWAKTYLKNNELSLEERRERERIRKAQAELALKEAEEKKALEEKARKEREKEAERLAAEQAKIRAKEEELAKALRIKEEKEAKERARKKCLEDERLRKEQLLAEERAEKERIKQEEAELLEKKAKLAKDFKEKAEKKLDCD